MCSQRSNSDSSKSTGERRQSSKASGFPSLQPSQGDVITYDDPAGRLERERILAQLKAASPSQNDFQELSDFPFEQMEDAYPEEVCLTSFEQRYFSARWHLTQWLEYYQCFCNNQFSCSSELVSIRLKVATYLFASKVSRKRGCWHSGWSTCLGRREGVWMPSCTFLLAFYLPTHDPRVE